jgi:hypothetical protein
MEINLSFQVEEINEDLSNLEVGSIIFKRNKVDKMPYYVIVREIHIKKRECCNES